MRFCTRCGRYGADADTRCPHCGADLVPSGVATRPPYVGRVRLIRFIGLIFIVGGGLMFLVAVFVAFLLGSVGTFGSHQGPSQRPLPLLFYVETAEAGILTVILIVVGAGLVDLKPWSRIGAIFVFALGVYLSLAPLITMYTPIPLPGPPTLMVFLAVIFPPIALLFALLALLLIVVFLTRSTRAAFVSGCREETAK